MIFAGAGAIDLPTLTEVETNDLTDAAVQTLGSIDASSVSLQVEPSTALLIKANPDDVLDLVGD